MALGAIELLPFTTLCMFVYANLHAVVSVCLCDWAGSASFACACVCAHFCNAKQKT